MPPVPGVRLLNNPVYDVPQEQYPTVIREMIRHENDLTNHRITWLLIGEGFIATAWTSVKSIEAPANLLLELAGILLALSAFVMLYQSYQARGYLRFLGHLAKQGALKEEQLPLLGWPSKRIKAWWRNSWVCPWFRRPLDLTEPWLLLPFLFTSMWMTALLKTRSSLNTEVSLTFGVILSSVILSVCCIGLVWSQGNDQESPKEEADG